MLVQCLFVQAHVDLRRSPGLHFIDEHSAETAQMLLSNKRGPEAPGPEACVICREAALFGGAMLGAAPGPALLVRRPLASSVNLVTIAARLQLSHAWQSRAPPILD